MTVDGAVHAGSAFGDAAEPVLLHQGKVEILIAFGGGAATDGWEGVRGCRKTGTSSTLLGPGYNGSESRWGNDISEGGVSRS